MQFVLAATPTFKAPVEVVTPGNNDDGATEKHQFIAEFKRMKTDELKAFLAENQPLHDALKEIVVGWTGLLYDDGSAVPFSSAHLDALLQIPHAVRSLWDTFVAYNSGATLKN